MQTSRYESRSMVIINTSNLGCRVSYAFVGFFFLSSKTLSLIGILNHTGSSYNTIFLLQFDIAS